jgi:glycosyltransferase involved in cell wall biosynthesis
VAPAFSIIVPAFNAEATLRATLASVDAQTDQDLEVIVVVDGSTDNTLALAQELARGKPWTVVHQANGGLPAARNAGLRAASGRWMALLDSDDWLLPGFLARMRELLTSAPDVGLAFVDAWLWEEVPRRFAKRAASGPYRPKPLPTGHWPFFLAIKEINFVYGAACAPLALVRDELGGFNEHLRAAEDWEMWMRIAATGRPCIGIDERLAIYRKRPGQMSKDLRRMAEGQLAAVRSVRGRLELPPEVAAAVDDRIRRGEADARRPISLRTRLAAPFEGLLAPARARRDLLASAPPEVAAAFPDLAY